MTKRKRKKKSCRQRYDHEVGKIPVLVTPTDDTGRPIGRKVYHEVSAGRNMGNAIGRLIGKEDV